jgi:RNA polymerase sigma-70 factor (ECF subfamily)
MTKNYTYNSNDVDAELVKKYLDGDSNAFTPLFNKYKPIFFSNVMKWYSSKYDVEEIQDMSMEFLGRISSKLHLYDSEKSTVSTWITNSMKNFIIEYWKRKKGKPINGVSLEDIAEPTTRENIYREIESKSYRKLIKKMIESLGSEDTRIFNEVFLKGKNQSDVARELNIKRSTFEYRVKRVKKRLEKFRPEDM